MDNYGVIKLVHKLSRRFVLLRLSLHSQTYVEFWEMNEYGELNKKSTKIQVTLPISFKTSNNQILLFNPFMFKLFKKQVILSWEVVLVWPRKKIQFSWNIFDLNYSGLSLSRTRKGLRSLFEIEKVLANGLKGKTFTIKGRVVEKG